MSEPLSYRCPFCDREVRVGSPCPGCAKPKKTGRKKPAARSWEQAPSADGLDLPDDDDFDYDDFVAREFGRAPHRRTGLRWYWWLLAVLVLLAIAAGLLV
jgi:hypothetical protein